MLVTPDRQLARQVGAALLKWGLNVDDSAGVPLAPTRTGHYLQLIAECSKEGSAHALALIKHPLARGLLLRSSEAGTFAGKASATGLSSSK